MVKAFFNAICYLINGKFDTEKLRLYIAQPFCNSTKGSCTNFTSYQEHLLKENMLDTIPFLLNYKQYTISMAMPYAEGKIEGGSFCLQWLATILKIHICLWSSTSKQIEKVFHSKISTNNTYKIITFKTSTKHMH